MRTAIYARVSTLNGQDPEMQLRELREYAARRGWDVTAGTEWRRPALSARFAAAMESWGVYGQGLCGCLSRGESGKDTWNIRGLKGPRSVPGQHNWLVFKSTGVVEKSGINEQRVTRLPDAVATVDVPENVEARVNSQDSLQ